MRFQPFHNRLSPNAENPLRTAQTHALLVSSQDLRFLLGAIAALWLQHPVRSAIFTVILRIPALIRSILPDVNAAASPTSIRGGSSYHVQHFHHFPLTPQPLPNAGLFKDLAPALACFARIKDLLHRHLAVPRDEIGPCNLTETIPLAM